MSCILRWVGGGKGAGTGAGIDTHAVENYAHLADSKDPYVTSAGGKVCSQIVEAEEACFPKDWLVGVEVVVSIAAWSTTQGRRQLSLLTQCQAGCQASWLEAGINQLTLVAATSSSEL
jgi:hypothetical protein